MSKLVSAWTKCQGVEFVLVASSPRLSWPPDLERDCDCKQMRRPQDREPRSRFVQSLVSWEGHNFSAHFFHFRLPVTVALLEGCRIRTFFFLLRDFRPHYLRRCRESCDGRQCTYRIRSCYSSSLSPCECAPKDCCRPHAGSVRPVSDM